MKAADVSAQVQALGVFFKYNMLQEQILRQVDTNKDMMQSFKIYSMENTSNRFTSYPAFQLT